MNIAFTEVTPSKIGPVAKFQAEENTVFMDQFEIAKALQDNSNECREELEKAILALRKKKASL